MRIGIVGRVEVPERLKLARQIVDHLRGRADLVATPRLAEALEVEGASLRSMQADVLVTVGGDGTILYALQQSDLPVCGVNMGEMGFLTSAQPRECPGILDRLLEDDYRIVERLKLATELNGERLPDATNEVVLKTPRPSKVLNIEVRIGGHEALHLMSDGVIVATPTGCTGYSLSAGGPLVDPRVECLLVVPLADFTVNSRPLLVPPDETIELRLEEEGKDGVLAVDGQTERTMTPDDVLAFHRADTPSRFVRFDHDFYERLHDRFR